MISTNNDFFSAKNICVKYKEKSVLENVTFSFNSNDKGHIIGLLGTNGCGKSTLFKAICNQQQHTGNCILNNTILENLSIKELSKRISYIPQKSGIHISISVLDVILMGYNPVLSVFSQPTKWMRKNAVAALNQVGLIGYSNRDFLTLSEGEKQLCIFARTIIENSPLLLLDEPDSALDFHNKYRIMKLLKSFINETKIVLVCLHDPILAMDFCDKLILLKNKSIQSIIEPKKDSIEHLQQELSKIYSEITIHEIQSQNNDRRLVLLSNTL